MQLQFAEILMYQQKHYKVLRNEPWDFCRSFLQISEQENHQEKLQTDGPKTKMSFMSVMYVSRFVNLAPVVQTLECAICQKNCYPTDKVSRKPITLSTG